MTANPHPSPAGLFRDICLRNGLAVSEGQLRLLEEYVALLLEWNQKINLISRKDQDNIWSRHILGSTAFLFHCRFKPDSSVADVGTGGGLPGVPLAILFDDLSLVLIDSIQKKITALSDILARLGLKNARAVCARAEDLAKGEEFAHRFDYVVARAVAPVVDLLKWTSPLLLQSKSVRAAGAAPLPPPPPPGMGSGAAQNGAPARTAITIPDPAVVMLKGGDLTAEVGEANRKVRPRSVAIYPILIEGATGDGVSEDHVDKKVVIIQP